MTMEGVWRVWIDTGGTFTDCVAVDPAGRWSRAKALSVGAMRAKLVKRIDEVSWEIAGRWTDDAALLVGASVSGAMTSGAALSATIVDARPGVITLDRPILWNTGELIDARTGEPAPILVARLATRTPAQEPLPPMRIRLATTKGTNALLERTTAPVAFFVTKGFADTLRIGDQRRGDLFALCITKPKPLHDMVVEISGRLDAAGNELDPIDVDPARVAARRALAAGVKSAAIALLHAWTNPAHELALASALRDEGFDDISVSHELAPRVGHMVRSQTAVVNAALAPVLGAYLKEIEASAPDAVIHVMSSAGGLKPARSFHPVEGLLSGPAGGVVGAAAVAKGSGFARLLTFDMGGTSTDVAKVVDRPELAIAHDVGGVNVFAPAIAIETVAAGGGSICDWDTGVPRVGPRSAGASPGPACYGAGGPLTITDVNALLGRLDTTRFETPLDMAAATFAAADVCERAGANWPGDAGDALLEGFLDIANERMAGAIRNISVRKGEDPSEFTLLAFGGAGPQHACNIAALLGVSTVCIPLDASLLSAVGLGASSLEVRIARQVLAPLSSNKDENTLDELLAESAAQAVAKLVQQNPQEASSEAATVTADWRMRYRGQEHALSVTASGASAARKTFIERYARTFGSTPIDRTVEVESISISATAPADSHTLQLHDAVDFGARNGQHTAQPMRTQSMRINGSWTHAPVFDWKMLSTSQIVEGPALIAQARTCAVIPHGWRSAIDKQDALIVQRIERCEHAQHCRASGQDETIGRELIINRLCAAAQEMGETLGRTAVSVNVKDRLDYSCALLDSEAKLVACAPHIPVHLGALGFCARAICEVFELAPGDVYITNHPAFGGSHLPDITVAAPVYDRNMRTLLGWTVSRAHHAEIGGVKPGSMSPLAKTLEEEGVVIAPVKLFDQGEPQWSVLESLLTKAAHPTRALEDNLADVRAAVAAAREAGETLQRICKEAGVQHVRDAMTALITRSDSLVRSAIKALGEKPMQARDRLDDGSTISVRITPDKLGGACVDFTGSAGQSRAPFNAPLSIARSAVAYVMRLLVGQETPLNEGLLTPITLIAPHGSLLNPTFDADPARCPPVAGGNVETSQRIVDVLLMALGLAANSQGTMNNIAFGNDRFSVYETIGGGSGATLTCPGASGVHVHMSNTAITDVERLETRAPVRIEEFSIRSDSGGAGVNRGGDGLRRVYRFSVPASVSLLTQRRTTQPTGLQGGGAGTAGAQWIERANGDRKALQHVASIEVSQGDRLVIETPGGGGAMGAPARDTGAPNSNT